MLKSRFRNLFVLFLVLLFLPLLATQNHNIGFEETTLIPDDGDFAPDTVNVFKIAKDVSSIFMDAVNSDVYNDVNGDTSALNNIFLTNYTSNDIGNAYRDALNEEIKAKKGDLGINLRGDYTENFEPGISIEEDLTFKRRFYVGLEWDIIKGGLFDAGNQIHQMKMETILKEYEALEYADKENYRYLFNYVNFLFNKKKIDVLKERRNLVEKQLNYTKELYHLRYVGWEKVLDYQSKLEDIDHQIYQYQNFNKHIPVNIPDTLINSSLTADELPLFDVDLDSLMKIYYTHHSDDTVTQIKLAIYKDNIKWWRDISLRPFVRYNMYMDEFNTFKNYGSAGVLLRVPIRFNNKSKLIKAQQAIYESEQLKELQGQDNELVNIYSEFGFKLKQIKDFYYKKMMNDELIRKELVKKEYRDPGFNPVYTLGLIDNKKAIEGEIIDLKKRMYINLVRLSFYLEDKRPTNFIKVLKPEDFMSRYNGSVKMFVTKSDLEQYNVLDISNYLWKNEFIDVLVEDGLDTLSSNMSTLLEKTKLGNIFFSIMKKVPINGEYPDVDADVQKVINMDEPNIIGLHYELDLLSKQDSLNELNEVDISNWLSEISQESVDGQIRLSIGIPDGLGINLLNTIFNKFDLVFVHETGVPNRGRVEENYASELNLNPSKLVLTLRGKDFADRMHLENYMSNLYENLKIQNFGFSDYSSMSNVDYRTFEKGYEINLQPGQLVASVRDQIYKSEDEKKNTALDQKKINEISAQKQIKDVSGETEKTIAADTVYRIQIAASKVKLSDAFLSRFKAGVEIREVKIDAYYKYTIGSFSNMDVAEEELISYKIKSGNTGAFIVTY